ncbi:MAG TPA: serine hydrolase [Candidatus Saccharimonadales bacterium]|nr:serine hydrolase [Candidatus Saccharimonadales bacterium]
MKLSKFRRAAFAMGLLACSKILVAEAQEKQNADAMAFPSDAEIHKMLAQRVDAIAGNDDGIGIVVGLIGPKGRRIISYGHGKQGDTRPLDGDTGFEIGSVTKVFTALLLADMVQKGEVALADPVAKYLPAGVKIPERNGRSITLLDLATHTSGLPFMHDESVASSGSPAGKNSSVQLFESVGRATLAHDIGTEWDYSNLGYWLLAQSLTRRSGADYESLLRTRILAPLKLTSTGVGTPSLKLELAVGHNAELQPTQTWYGNPMYSEMQAAGGLASTANDLLTFLAASMGYERSPLGSAMTSMLDTRRPTGRLGEAQALGWLVLGEGDDLLIVHDGGTWGYASSLAWDPKNRIGVVALANQVAGVDDIPRHLLRPAMPLRQPASSKHTEITLASDILNRYTGKYEAEGQGIFIIARERDFLTFQAPSDWGLPKLRIRPESLHDFFAAELPLQVTLETDSEGRVTGLLIHPPRGQHAVPAKRLDSDH